jgi:hypothetical protein
MKKYAFLYNAEVVRNPPYQKGVFMKNLILILVSSISFNAFADDVSFGEVLVDFNGKHLEETGVMQCDDTYYIGLDITVIGSQKYHDYDLSFEGPMDWKVISTKATNYYGQPATILHLEGNSTATIKVHERRPLKEGKPRVFTVDISDAC